MFSNQVVGSSYQYINYCECGCGEELKNKNTRFLFNHHRRKEVTQDKDYEYIYTPNHPYRNHKNKVYRHHLVVEEYYTKKWGYKFYIHRSLIVHHKDFNPKNNDFSNLQIMPRPDHIALHKKKDMSERKCCFCNSSETYKGKDGYYKWYKSGDNFFCRKCRWRIKKE
jgi:hypothetical protein